MAFYSPIRRRLESNLERTRNGIVPRDRNGGFTLIELLVVLVILGLVMGIAGPRVLGYLSSSRERAASLQITSFKSALDLYYLDMGRYPSASEGLDALVERPAAADSWRGPYLQQPDVPQDPWGHPYRYLRANDGTPYRIVSAGADGQEGGSGEDADIASN